MSVTSKVPYIKYLCTGVTEFEYEFKIIDEEDLEVTRISPDGTETVLEQATHYTIDNSEEDEGGSIETVETYVDGNIQLRRVMEQSQSIRLVSGPLPASRIEEGLDRSVMLIQQLSNDLDLGALIDAASEAAAAALSAGDAEAALVLTELAQNAAEEAQAAAELAVASVNLPLISGGDTGKMLIVNAAEDGYDLVEQPEVDDTSDVPAGVIMPYVGGYFTSGSNGGFTSVTANTIAEVNALLNSKGYYVCDGSALNLPTSPIFNGSGRYLPNLTDDRFIMGDATTGVIGGSNTMNHTHGVNNATLSTSQLPSHRLGFAAGFCSANGNNSNIWGSGCSRDGTHYTDYIGSGLPHNHGTTTGASYYDNKPQFLGCIYIMKVF